MSLAGVLFALVPGFAWLVFYLREDPHPEPRRLIAFTFLSGMAAAIFAFQAEVFVTELLKNFGVLSSSLMSAHSFSPYMLILLAAIEEVAKFLAAYLAVHKSSDFDEPVDAMIYMVTAALGFATIENIGAVSGAHTQTALMGAAIEAASLRFIGATLLHTLTSGILGYYWAMSIREFDSKLALALGIVLASGLHAIFNYLILTFGNLINSVIFVVIVAFFALNDFEKLKRSSV